MAYCFCGNILGNYIILLCLCLHSVYRLLCLSFAVMVLVCGDVSIMYLFYIPIRFIQTKNNNHN